MNARQGNEGRLQQARYDCVHLQSSTLAPYWSSPPWSPLLREWFFQDAQREEHTDKWIHRKEKNERKEHLERKRYKGNGRFLLSFIQQSFFLFNNQPAHSPSLLSVCSSSSLGVPFVPFFSWINLQTYRSFRAFLCRCSAFDFVTLSFILLHRSY